MLHRVSALSHPRREGFRNKPFTNRSSLRWGASRGRASTPERSRACTDGLVLVLPEPEADFNASFPRVRSSSKQYRARCLAYAGALEQKVRNLLFLWRSAEAAGMATILRTFVVLSAALQAALIALFAFAALEGDDWGIARAMALLLAVPFLAFAGPAFFGS
jgi:hypothetical protein